MEQVRDCPALSWIFLVCPPPPEQLSMADLVVRVGGYSAQGLRPKNEDRFVADPERHVFLVADGMGGQECGERASGLAVEIIPRTVDDLLAAHQAPDLAVRRALE